MIRRRAASRLAIPNFRRLGVLARLLLLTEGLRWLWLLLQATISPGPTGHLLASVGLFEPVLLSVAAVLVAASPWLQRCHPRTALVAIAVGAVLVALGWRALLHAWAVTVPSPLGVMVATLAVWAALALYFDWRQQRLSPALVEARLQALQSRMRPHFLFNSLNSVLALIRRDPAGAEAMLEDLAELYRALLAQPRALVPLGEDLALARAYLAVEQRRLGQRLQVVWHVDTVPADVLLPCLTVQPLVENAVRHGIEPHAQGGRITVEAFHDNDDLLLFVRNPLPPPAADTHGHGVALDNLRERLELLYDGQARLRIYVSEGEFCVQVRLPIRTGVITPEPPQSAP